MGTSVGYWREWADSMLSFFNLRGRYSPSKFNILEDGRCYGGSEIGTLSTSAWRCLEKCRAVSGCTAWTHEINSGLCTLFEYSDQYMESDSCTSGYFP